MDGTHGKTDHFKGQTQNICKKQNSLKLGAMGNSPVLMIYHNVVQSPSSCSIEVQPVAATSSISKNILERRKCKKL
jgi:hypothetical protein